MQDDFVFLTAVSDYEIELVCQRLKEAGIEYLIKDANANVWQRQYGGASLLGKEINVKSSQLAQAKKLLNIEDSALVFPSQNRKIFKFLKIPVAIYLILFITLLAVSTYFLIKERFGNKRAEITTSDCDKIQNLEEKDSCYYDVAQYKEDPLICDKIKIYYKDSCYWYIVLMGKKDQDPSICEKIQDQNLKSHCYNLVNSRTGTSSNL